MQIFENANFNFIKWRMHAVVFSTIFVLIGVALAVTRGLNFGIDFAGGANVIVRFQQPTPISELRQLPMLNGVPVQQFGKSGENSFLIRFPAQKGEGDLAGQVVKTLNTHFNGDVGNKVDINFQGRAAIAELLKSKDPDRKGPTAGHDYYYGVATNVIAARSKAGIFTNINQATSAPGVTAAAANVLRENAVLGKFNVLSQETVGPQVGRELQTKAIWAVILSTIAMGIYIWIRFDLSFGMGAIACLIHDVLICFAFVAMIRAEISLVLVAAFLMVIGYSVNDTVVNYDRFRENRKKSRAKLSFEEELNHSLNQTLSRTILTSGCVILVLIALIMFGGSVINDFSWVLLIGIIAGTYSTLTIVPAFVIAWNNFVTRRQNGAVREPARVEPVSAPKKVKAKG